MKIKNSFHNGKLSFLIFRMIGSFRKEFTVCVFWFVCLFFIKSKYKQMNQTTKPQSKVHFPSSFFFSLQKQYARSDVHLSEIFDDVCDSMKDYALTQSPDDARKLGVTRIRSRSGEELDTSNVGFNENLQRTFKNYVSMFCGAT